MAMVDQFQKGMFLMIDGNVNLVEDRRYKTQGRQGGLVILSLRNAETGQNTSITIKAGVKLEQIEPEYKEMQYSYSEGDDHYFMDGSTYEMVSLDSDLLGGYEKYLKEGDKYIVMFYEGKALSIKTNPTVHLKITSAPEAVKGNTANTATKKATTETGLVVDVPMFVNTGDVIIVNTETGEYKGRE